MAASRVAVRRYLVRVHRLGAAALLIVGAVALSLVTFFATAATVVWLVETFEGEISECNRGQCGMFGEFLDNHDLVAVIVLAVFAALPGSALLWMGRSRLTSYLGKSS